MDTPQQPVAFPQIPSWELVQSLAACNYTMTFRARPEGSNSHADYVVKLPRDDRDTLGRQLIQREAFVGQSTTSAHLSTVLYAHDQSPPFYIVLPYHDGTDLSELIRSAGRIPLAKALWVVRQVLDGAASLHERGWVHRDIKPANIIVSPLYHATLIDLGLAASMKASGGAGEIGCTPSYSAPEHFSSSYPPQAAADAYSCGVVLYEMLTGVVPFPQDAPYSLVVAHMNETPPDPRRFQPDIPHRVVRLLRAMLAKQPLRRPSDDELKQWLGELEVEYFDDRWNAQSLIA